MKSEEFWGKVRVGKKDECWEWEGARQLGYGQWENEGQRMRAHQYAWEEAKGGRIGEGFEIHHRCRNRLCVNVRHLEVVTKAEHGRLHAGENCVGFQKSKTHCPAGHEYTEENTYLVNGARNCRACKLAKQKERYHRAKAGARYYRKVLTQKKAPCGTKSG